MGLAIALRFARLLSGDIEVESKLGAGSTFTLRVPAYTPAATGLPD
jgi:signal transduction histidine kinase